MTQKILAAHSGLDQVVPDQLISAKLDLVLGNDITTPVAVKEFKKVGFDRVFKLRNSGFYLIRLIPADSKNAKNYQKYQTET